MKKIVSLLVVQIIILQLLLGNLLAKPIYAVIDEHFVDCMDKNHLIISEPIKTIDGQIQKPLDIIDEEEIRYKKNIDDQFDKTFKKYTC